MICVHENKKIAEILKSDGRNLATEKNPQLYVSGICSFLLSLNWALPRVDLLFGRAERDVIEAPESPSRLGCVQQLAPAAEDR